MTDCASLIDLCSAAPFAVLAAGAVSVMLFEVLFNGGWPRADFSAVVLFLAFVAAIGEGTSSPAFAGLLYTDGIAQVVSLLMIGVTLLIVLLWRDALSEEQIDMPGEYYCLMLISLCGALVFANAAELITLFIGLELLSIPLYCLVGSAVLRERSIEGGLKYFLLGSFSSAFLLYGIALFYGATGTTSLAGIATRVAAAPPAYCYAALVMMLIGLFFKLAAVPFHYWCPDAYQGAPTPVTCYMATVVKVAAFTALLRVLWIAMPGLAVLWSPVVWIVAALSMTLGNFVALRQVSVKRMLAYSGIAHAGYLLTAALAPGAASAAALLFYLLTYAITNTGALALVSYVASGYEAPGEADSIEAFQGLGTLNPALAAVFSVLLFALAGLPPGMAGLIGKFFVFNAAAGAGYTALIVISVINSAVSCYYYLRIMVAMYFRLPAAAQQKLELPLLSRGVLYGLGLAVLLLGLVPMLVMPALTMTQP